MTRASPCPCAPSATPSRTPTSGPSTRPSPAPPWPSTAPIPIVDRRGLAGHGHPGSPRDPRRGPQCRPCPTFSTRRRTPSCGTTCGAEAQATPRPGHRREASRARLITPCPGGAPGEEPAKSTGREPIIHRGEPPEGQDRNPAGRRGNPNARSCASAYFAPAARVDQHEPGRTSSKRSAISKSSRIQR